MAVTMLRSQQSWFWGLLLMWVVLVSLCHFGCGEIEPRETVTSTLTSEQGKTPHQVSRPSAPRSSDMNSSSVLLLQEQPSSSATDISGGVSQGHRSDRESVIELAVPDLLLLPTTNSSPGEVAQTSKESIYYAKSGDGEGTMSEYPLDSVTSGQSRVGDLLLGGRTGGNATKGVFLGNRSEFHNAAGSSQPADVRSRVTREVNTTKIYWPLAGGRGPAVTSLPVRHIVSQEEREGRFEPGQSTKVRSLTASPKSSKTIHYDNPKDRPTSLTSSLPLLTIPVLDEEDRDERRGDQKDSYKDSNSSLKTAKTLRRTPLEFFVATKSSSSSAMPNVSRSTSSSTGSQLHSTPRVGPRDHLPAPKHIIPTQAPANLLLSKLSPAKRGFQEMKNLERTAYNTSHTSYTNDQIGHENLSPEGAKAGHTLTSNSKRGFDESREDKEDFSTSRNHGSDPVESFVFTSHQEYTHYHQLCEIASSRMEYGSSPGYSLVRNVWDPESDRFQKGHSGSLENDESPDSRREALGEASSASGEANLTLTLTNKGPTPVQEVLPGLDYTVTVRLPTHVVSLLISTDDLEVKVGHFHPHDLTGSGRSSSSDSSSRSTSSSSTSFSTSSSSSSSQPLTSKPSSSSATSLTPPSSESCAPSKVAGRGTFQVEWTLRPGYIPNNIIFRLRYFVSGFIRSLRMRVPVNKEYLVELKSPRDFRLVSEDHPLVIYAPYGYTLTLTPTLIKTVSGPRRGRARGGRSPEAGAEGGGGGGGGDDDGAFSPSSSSEGEKVRTGRSGRGLQRPSTVRKGDQDSCSSSFVEITDTLSTWKRCDNGEGDMDDVVSSSNVVGVRVSGSHYGGGGKGVGLKLETRPGDIHSLKCGWGWVSRNDRCYLLVTRRMTWHAAESGCVQRGGHLATVTDHHVAALLDLITSSSVNNRPDDAYWIGASDTTYENSFMWTSGAPFTYTNWFPGWQDQGGYSAQPSDDGLGEEDCVELRRTFRLATKGQRVTPALYWNDRNCAAQNKFLCEKRVYGASSSVPDLWTCNRTIEVEPPGVGGGVPGGGVGGGVGGGLVRRPGSMGGGLVITSPGFPSFYPAARTCVTTLKSPPGTQLVLDFDIFMLEPHPECAYDWLQISEPGHNVTFRRCGEWTSKLKLLRHASSSNSLVLTFVSDFSHSFQGYRARVSTKAAGSECGNSNFLRRGHTCFLYVSYPQVTWFTAQHVCRDMEAELARVDNTETLEWLGERIQELAEYSGRSVYWVGASQDPASLTWAWPDGTHLNTSLLGKIEANLIPEDDTHLCLSLQEQMLSSSLHLHSSSHRLALAAHQCDVFGGYICSKRAQDQQPGQNRTIVGVEGNVSSPNFPAHYSNDLHYTITLRGPANTRLLVAFSRLDLEYQADCLYDYVGLRGRPDDASVRYCGQHSSKMDRFDYVSDTNEVLLTFHSDWSVTGTGFAAQWQAVEMTGCPSRELFEPTGHVASPNYPKYYLSSLHCQTTIHAPEGERVWLQFEGFEVGTPGTRAERGGRDTSSERDPNLWLSAGPPAEGQASSSSASSSASDGSHLRSRASRRSENKTMVTLLREESLRAESLRAEGLWAEGLRAEGLRAEGLWAENGGAAGSRAGTNGKKRSCSQDYVELVLGDGPGETVRLCGHVSISEVQRLSFLSYGRTLKIVLHTTHQGGGIGFKAKFSTGAHFAETSVLILGQGTASTGSKGSSEGTGVRRGGLHALNFPLSPPRGISFTQHLQASPGYQLRLRIFNVVESTTYREACPQDYVEIQDWYKGHNGSLWRICGVDPSSVREVSIRSTLNSLVVKEVHVNSSSPRSPGLLPVMAALSSSSSSSSSFSSSSSSDGASKRSSIEGFTVSYEVHPDNLWLNRSLEVPRARGVASCEPSPCLNGGLCVSQGANNHSCHCNNGFTGTFCQVTWCELQPCVWGSCQVDGPGGYLCKCRRGYGGARCHLRLSPCTGNPCQSRGSCTAVNDTFHCQCHAWWEGERCERRMLRIPYKPLSERMLEEPFWLGLITVAVVMGIIGIVFCIKKHFADKIEKFFAEEIERSKYGQMSPAAPPRLATLPSPTGLSPQPRPKSLFVRLNSFRKASLLSLSSTASSPQCGDARTFSFDDLIKSYRRGSSSPRRNKSRSQAASPRDSKKILRQLVTPPVGHRAPSFDELLHLQSQTPKCSVERTRSADIATELRVENTLVRETSLSSIVPSPTKQDKKVTFAKLLDKMSKEMSSSSSDVSCAEDKVSNRFFGISSSNNGGGGTSSSSRRSPRRSPRSRYAPKYSTGSGSEDVFETPDVSSSEMTPDPPKRLLSVKSASSPSSKTSSPQSRTKLAKISSADSLLAMFRSFGANNRPNASTPTSPHGSEVEDSSAHASPSTTPTTPPKQHQQQQQQQQEQQQQQQVVKQDSLTVPGAMQVQVHAQPGSSQLSGPVITLEVPSGDQYRCLSPITELPTPMPTPIPSPLPTPSRSRQVNLRSSSDSSAPDVKDSAEDTESDFSISISVEQSKSSSDSPVLESRSFFSPTSSSSLAKSPASGSNSSFNGKPDVPSLSLHLPDGGGRTSASSISSNNSSTSPVTSPKVKLRPPPINIPNSNLLNFSDTNHPCGSNAPVVKLDIPTIKIEDDDDETTLAPFDSTPRSRSQSVDVGALQAPTITISQAESPPAAAPLQPQEIVVPTFSITVPSPPAERRLAHPILECKPPPIPTISIECDEDEAPHAPLRKKVLLGDLTKPGSLDLPHQVTPVITVTANMSEIDSDTDSPIVKSKTGMCHLSPFLGVDRTISESNLSSSGYSSAYSPGPSRCSSNNPLCPGEADEPMTPSVSSIPSKPVRLPTTPPQTTAVTPPARSKRRPLLKSPVVVESGNGGAGGGAGGGGGTPPPVVLLQHTDSETTDDPVPFQVEQDSALELDTNDDEEEEEEEEEDEEVAGDGSDESQVPKNSDCDSGECEPTQRPRILVGGSHSFPKESPRLHRSPPAIVVHTSLHSESSLEDYLADRPSKLSPVSSRSESPISDSRLSVHKYSPAFFGKSKSDLPFTDSDGLYDCPSSEVLHSDSQKSSPLKRLGRRKIKRTGAKLKSLLVGGGGGVASNGEAGSGSGVAAAAAATSSSNSVGLSAPKTSGHLELPPWERSPRRLSPKRRMRAQTSIDFLSSSNESLTSQSPVGSCGSPLDASPIGGATSEGRQEVFSSSAGGRGRRRRPLLRSDSIPTKTLERQGSVDASGEETQEEQLMLKPPRHQDELPRHRKISRFRNFGNQIRKKHNARLKIPAAYRGCETWL